MKRNLRSQPPILGLLAAMLLPPSLPAATERIIRPDGDVDLIETRAGSPFTIFRRQLHNPGTEDREVRTIEFVRHLPLVGTARDYRTLGVDGLQGAELAASSYLFLAMAKPDARDGTVAGWITQERGSGSVHSRATPEGLTITGRLEFGQLRIKPGRSVITDAMAIGSFADARLGLETYADTIAEVNRIELPKIPNGYCTWYSSPHGGASDEKALAELAAFCGRELTRYGFDTILVDDQWQGPAIPKGGIIGTGPTGNFTRHDPQGPYPSGMKANADKLAASGIRAGLWFTPFSWDPRDPLFESHQDWFVKKTDGSLYEVLWAGWCLDMTHPNARAFLADSVRRITRDWGYRYLKPDAMWCGLAAKCTYPGTAYVDENFGDAVFHDPYLTGIEAYRAGIRTMREAAGPGTYIAACNVAQNFRSMGGAIGLVDAMRIGPDTGADWGAILPNFHLGTRLYFLHNRVWHNDPDCLMVRAPLTLTQARSFASWIALSGSLNLVSEWLPGLPPDRLDCIKRSMPNTGLAARPLDLFEHMPARVWHLTDGQRQVVGLFNWDGAEPANVSVRIEELGLKTEGARFLGLDYWSGRLLPIQDGVVSAELPPSGCGIIAIATMLDHPQLLGTSRHITQCFVDVGEERWDNARLSGTCKLVGGDVTELRIATDSMLGAWIPRAAELSGADRTAGVTIEMREEPGLLRVTLAAPVNRDVQWSVGFEAPPAAVSQTAPVSPNASPPPILSSQKELAAFLNCRIVPQSGNAWDYTIVPGPFPSVGWDRPEVVEKVMGGFPLEVRWFNGDGTEVTTAERPGRYAFYAEGTTPCGQTVRRAGTIFCRPKAWDGWSEKPRAYLDFLPLDGLTRSAWDSHREAIAGFAGRTILLSILRQEEGAILMSWLHELESTSTTPALTDTPLIRDHEYHLALKRKILGVADKYPSLRPPRSSRDQSAPVLRAGTEAEAGFKPGTAAKLREVCEAWFAESREPFSLVVARHGVMVLDASFGEYTWGPMTRNTPAEIASISKLVTGMLFAQFVDQGLIGIDDPVGKYLPDFPVTGDQVPTLRHCFTHATALDGHEEWGGMHNPWLDNVIANADGHLWPGQIHNYNGMGYDLAGKVMEIVSGKSVFRLMRENIFDPLEMSHTTMEEDLGFSCASTAADLAKIGQLLLNQGGYGALVCFTPETFERLLPQPLNRFYPAIPDLEWGIGLTWMRQSRPGAGHVGIPKDATVLGRNIIGHGSATSAILRVDLAHDLVITQSRRRGGADYDRHLTQLLLAIEAGLEQRGLTTEATASTDDSARAGGPAVL